MKLVTQSGEFLLERLPKTDKGDLRAWDAADELLLSTLFENHLNNSPEHSSAEPVEHTPPVLHDCRRAFVLRTLAFCFANRLGSLIEY